MIYHLVVLCLHLVGLGTSVVFQQWHISSRVNRIPKEQEKICFCFSFPLLSFLLLVKFSLLLFFPLFLLCKGKTKRSNSQSLVAAAAKSQNTEGTEVSWQKKNQKHQTKRGGDSWASGNIAVWKENSTCNIMSHQNLTSKCLSASGNNIKSPFKKIKNFRRENELH